MLGNGTLRVALFDSRWDAKAGVATRLPLGRADEGHTRLVREAGGTPPAGFYAVVSEEPHRVTAAVDRIRSIPIFYGRSRDGGFRLSDRADWVRDEVQATDVLIGARNDFLLAGYVTGENTLFDGVKQLQAGQRLDAREIDGRVEVVVDDYFLFKRSYSSLADDEALESELESVLTIVMERMVELAAGRQIAIPLSGGNDSRVIAMYLSSMCPDRVVTFAYGRPALGEVAISRAVAEALGLEWHFVEGTERFWSDLRNSKDVQLFLNRVTNSHRLLICRTGRRFETWSSREGSRRTQSLPQDTLAMFRQAE